MRQSHIFTFLLLAQLLVALLWVRPVQAVDDGSLAGSVFVDGNGNGLVEPEEAAVAGALVHVRSQANPVLELTAQTNSSGYFVLNNVPYGVYDVWATAEGQSGFYPVVAGISEVNAQVLLDVPVSSSAASAQLLRTRALFFPLVTNAQ
jgi:hypothetical protein